MGATSREVKFMTLDQFRRAAGISQATAERWHPHMEKVTAAFGIDTPKLLAAFIAQIGTESGGFLTIKESFNYSPEGLRTVFPTRISAEVSLQLGRRPNEKSVPLERQMQLANLLYGGRYGNDTVGDGWKFRGRGLKQVTFRDNYDKCGDTLGLDLLSDPDLLLIDANAAMSAGWYWSYANCSKYANADDFVGLTKAINGGTNGLKDRQVRWAAAKKVLIA